MRLIFAWFVPVMIAGVSPAIVQAESARDLFPPASSTFASSTAAARGDLGLAAGTREYHAPMLLQEGADAAGSPDQQSYLPVLYSTLVPGLGEISMGYWKRGVALMAAEVVAWSGYFVKHNDGMDARDAYEAFADAHWNFDKWIEDHPCPTVPPGGTLEDVEECGRATSGSGAWPGYIPWVSKEEDKQHYYENIGKYDWYISGWSDWNAADAPLSRQTELRTTYRSMRQESNDALDTANSFIWLSIAARVFSIAETAIIVHNRRETPQGAGAGDGSPVALRARPRGFTGGEVALEVRFK